jgi:paraquat-inducible protein B
MNESKPPHTTDHGELVPRGRRSTIWVWIFPILAALAAGWIFWQDARSMGPAITILFDETPGIAAGKTPLVYLGVESGMVESVKLDDQLAQVVVSVRLKKFAAHLASRDTVFWIERPVVTLTELAGLESIVQGNSIRARNPGGPPNSTFEGLSSPPLQPLLPGSFSLTLRGADIPHVGVNAPVYHRGVKAGYVRAKHLDDKGEPVLDISITPDFRDTIRTTSRFWPIPAGHAALGPDGVTLELMGLDTIIQGSIAYDHFTNEGMKAADLSTYWLFDDEFEARCSGTLATLVFDNAEGLVPGRTTVNYLGAPAGLIVSIDPDPANGSVSAEVAFDPRYDDWLAADSLFTVVRPRISLQGVSGLETLVRGPYVAWTPGTAEETATTFVARSVTEDEWEELQNEENGLVLVLTAAEVPDAREGAPLLHRGVAVGKILECGLEDDGGGVVVLARVNAPFKRLVNASTRFWSLPAATVSARPGGIDLGIGSLGRILNGAIAFDDFGSPGRQAREGDRFPLLADENSARATSAPFTIEFRDARGIEAGRTPICHLGVPVGMVESLRVGRDSAIATIRLEPGLDFLRASDSIFSVIRPNVSLQGISGVDTLITGPYIECVPGSSKTLASSFKGRSLPDAGSIPADGLRVLLKTGVTAVQTGASVYYKGIPVGTVTAKNLSKDGAAVLLEATIGRDFERLVRTDSVFWDASGLEASFGFVKFKIESGPLSAPVGRIVFATPPTSPPAPRAVNGTEFTLAPKPRPEWEKWSPSFPE